MMVMVVVMVMCRDGGTGLAWWAEEVVSGDEGVKVLKMRIALDVWCGDPSNLADS